MGLTRYRMPTEFTKNLSKDEELYFGFDPSYTRADIDFYSVIPNFEDPDFDFEEAPLEKINTTVPFTNVDAWTGVDRKMGNFKITPGLRVYYNQLIDKTSYDPRLRGRYEVDEQNVLKMAVGQYSKAPEPQESSEEFGNPDLDYERSIHYILGLETKWSERWLTEFQIFYKDAFDVVTASGVKSYDNEGSFHSYGFEAFLRRNLTARLFGWLSYTYSETKFRDRDSDPYRISDYDQTHVVNFASNYRMTSTWDLGGRLAYHTGKPYTPITNAVYNANLDKYQPRENDADVNSERLPDYTSISIYSSNDILFDTWKMTVKYGLESYSPGPQVVGVSYNYDYSKKSYQKFIGTIPFLEVRGEF
jgi:hypothetical protein